MDKEHRSFSFQDVLALPQLQDIHDTREFVDSTGRKWPVTIWADGKVNADRFYTLRQLLATPLAEEASGKPPAPLKLTLPGGKVVEIRNAAYIGCLNVLEAVSVSPKLTAMEWAVFGASPQIGPQLMDDITDWVTNVNGLSDWFQAQVALAKNASSAEPLHGKNGSSAHPLTSLKTSPKEPLKA